MAASEALARARRDARATGARAARWSRCCGRGPGCGSSRGDEAGALADFDEAVRLAPKDPETLSLRAYAEQQLGRQEEAIRDFGLLYGITVDPDALFRQAFGWQRIGEGRADVGDVDGALKAYAEALALYDAGAARHPEAVSMLLYGGEVRGLRARLRTGEARGGPPRGPHRARSRARDEVRGPRRRSSDAGEVRLLAGDTAGALEDLRAAVGDRKDATPRYYGRFARAAIERSREELAAGRRAESAALAAEAVEASERAIGPAPGPRPLRAPDARDGARARGGRRGDAGGEGRRAPPRRRRARRPRARAGHRGRARRRARRRPPRTCARSARSWRATSRPRSRRPSSP